jgi:hypothetical protein
MRNQFKGTVVIFHFIILILPASSEIFNETYKFNPSAMGFNSHPAGYSLT